MFDSWTPVQLQMMKLGGNGRASTFFRRHGYGSTSRENIPTKYKSTAAELYREQLASEVGGKPHKGYVGLTGFEWFSSDQIRALGAIIVGGLLPQRIAPLPNPELSPRSWTTLKMRRMRRMRRMRIRMLDSQDPGRLQSNQVVAL